MLRHIRLLLLIATATVVGACESATAPASATSATTAYTGPGEGDWTPTVGGNATYLIQSGRWHRVNNLVWVTGTLYVNTLGTGSAGQITGLPFESIDGHEPSGTVGHWKDLSVNVTSLTITVRPNSSSLAFHGALSADTKSVTLSPLKDGSLVYFSISYEAKP